LTDKIQISNQSTGLLFTLLGKSNLSIFDNDFELKQQSQTLGGLSFDFLSFKDCSSLRFGFQFSSSFAASPP